MTSMNHEDVETLRAVCSDLMMAADVGEDAGMLDEDEAQMSRELATHGLRILAKVEAV